MSISNLDKKYFKLSVNNKIVKESDTQLQARCPICGDSKKNPRKARLYLYQYKDTTLVHCFNCGWHSNVPNYLKQVDINLYTQYIEELKAQKLQNLKNYVFTSKKEEKIILNKSNGLYTFDIPSCFISVNLDNTYRDWLINIRKFKIEWLKYFYISKCDKISINSKELYINNYLIIPFKYNDNKLFGFQARTINKKIITYLPEENKGFSLWNYNNIVKQNKKIYVFESIFDALSSGIDIKYITAINGISLSYREEEFLKSHYKDIIFVLDNQNTDKASYNNSLKYLNKGFKVYIWDKSMNVKDINDYWKEKKEYLDIDKDIYQGLKGIIKLKTIKWF